MRTRPAYTPCKLYTDGFEELQAGEYMTTPAGSGYLITEVRRSPKRPGRQNLR